MELFCFFHLDRPIDPRSMSKIEATPMTVILDAFKNIPLKICFYQLSLVFLGLSFYFSKSCVYILFLSVVGWTFLQHQADWTNVVECLWIMIHHNSVRSRVLTLTFSGSLSLWRTIWAASNIDTILVYTYINIHQSIQSIRMYLNASISNNN